MKKLALALLVVLGIGVAAVWLSLNSIVGTAIEDGATHALGVESRVGFVRLRLLDGRLGLTSIRIANPEGFDEPHFVDVGSAELAVDLSSLPDEVIEIPLISLSDVDLALEREGDRTNFGAILEHMKSFEKGKAKPAPEAEGPGRRLVVRLLRIENVSARVEWSAVAADTTGLAVDIPVIELRNLGERGGGITTAQLSNLVVKALLSAVARQGGGLPRALLSELDTGLRGVGRLPSMVVRGAGDTLGEAAKSVGGEAVGDAVRALGGLLGRDEAEKK
jgi:hypothetical protein